MSADTNNNPDNIIPYETLKASLDEAAADMEAKSAALLEAYNRQDPPLYIKIALHNFDTAYATVRARTNAIVSEYGHLAGVTQNIQKQRDDTNRRYESLKKTVRQLKQLDLDDETDANNAPNSNNSGENAKGRKRKK